MGGFLGHLNGITLHSFFLYIWSPVKSAHRRRNGTGEGDRRRGNGTGEGDLRRGNGTGSFSVAGGNGSH